LPRLRFEPLMKIRLLGGAELYAGVDAVDGFVEGACRGIDRMIAEEAGDLLSAFGGAEGAGGGNDADARVGGELGVHLVPVLLDVGPGLGAGGALAEEDNEDSPAILIADLTGDGVVERTGDKGGIAEAGQRGECVRLKARVAGVLAGGKYFVVKGGVAVAGGDGDGCVGQKGVFILLVVVAKAAVGDLLRLGDDGWVVGNAEQFEEDRPELAAVEGVVLRWLAECGVDRTELAADDRIELIEVLAGGDLGLDSVNLAESGFEDGGVRVGRR
jgi:hypothetical protein